MDTMVSTGAAEARMMQGSACVRRRLSPWLVLLVVLALSPNVQAQQLVAEDFTDYANGSLSGQGSWVGLNVSSLAFHVDNAAPVPYACYAGGNGGRYAAPAAGGAPYNQRLRRNTDSWIASSNQTFYTAFVINVSAAGSDPEAHVLGLGSEFSGTRYEFLRVHVRSAGAGVVHFGISKGNSAGLGGNADAGIEWSTSTFALGQPHLLITRYSYVNGGGAAGDALHLWVNPDIASEPLAATAAAIIPPGARGNDTLFDSDTVRNIYLASRDQGGVSPAFALDGLRHARGATSAQAWTQVDAGQANTVPTISTSASPVTVLGPTSFSVTVGDAETPLAALGLTAVSADAALIPPSGIVVQSGGGVRTITVTPAPGRSGSTTITLTVTDGCGGSASTTVTATVPSYGVTPSAGPNGSISPDTVQTIAHGSSTQFSVMPNANHTARVTGCGGTLKGNTFTTAPITAPCTVLADFVFNSFSASPGTVDIGNVIVGEHRSVQINLANSGNTALDVTTLSSALPPFVRTDQGSCSNTLPFTIAAQSSCTLNYRFAPAAVGPVQQVFSVLATAPRASEFVLSGNGVGVEDRVFANSFE
ncbi:MAG: hypothetical protein JNN30_14975 [Rhodanobacteraceae bacterium]|nr:hypothetical protein [Rhodanobacteraceae bacterium]